MIHLIKRTKYAIRPHKCPSDCCPHVDNTDYIHACFTCPNVKKVWAHVMKLWVRMGNNEYTQKTFHNLILGLPIMKHDDSPTPPAPVSWTVVNSTVTRCLWVASVSVTYALYARHGVNNVDKPPMLRRRIVILRLLRRQCL